MHTIEYEQYLKSREWKSKRAARIDLDRHRCALCGSQDQLNVHHLSYARFMRENIETDLITLCPKCHRFLHKMMGNGTDWWRKGK